MGVKNLDEALQMVHRAIRDKAIKWNDFRPVGVEDDYHDWYYAEDRLYVIHDKIMDTIVFYQGKSPKDAYESWQMDIRDIWSNNDEEVE